MSNRIKLIVLGWILVGLGVLGFFEGFPLGQGPVWYQIVKIIAGLYLGLFSREEAQHSKWGELQVRGEA